jgi:trans-L-3-hydroxyproline dehydratase
MKRLAELENWKPPAHWTRISTIDMHTGGEPLRVVTSGLPPIEGSTVLEKRRYFRDHYDHIRTGIMWEPRGHADMYGTVITPSHDADFDVFFLHNEGYSTMCGHAIIALTTLLIDTGTVRLEGDNGDASQLAIDFNVPAGRIQAKAIVENGKAREVTFRNVPSFVFSKSQQIEVPALGNLQFDIAYGGAFYALVDGSALGLDLAPEHLSRLIEYGRRIKQAIVSTVSIEHPFEPDLSFLYGTIFTGRARNPAHHSRNVCIFADGELDRSPTGSGVSARAALHFAKGELALNQLITIESILGSTMTVRAVEKIAFGPYDAVIPEVGGTAFVTGRNEWYFDPNDPFCGGFIMRQEV